MKRVPQPHERTPESQKQREVFHSRAAKSGDEFRKLVISLTIGAFGVFFVTLTGENASTLSQDERVALLAALLALAIATLSGLLAWYYAGRDFHDKADHGAEFQGRNHDAKKWLDLAMTLFFCIGVMASLVYLVLRILMASP